MAIILFKGGKDISLLEYFGLLVFGYTLVKLSWRALANAGTFFLGLGSANLKQHGAWAVVTGCTDGIGKAYAEHLAKRGLNVVLISRTQSKLTELAAQLRDKYAVQTRTIAVDFTEPNTIYANIRTQLEDLDVGVLVNNVGISHEYPDYFDVFGQSDKAVNDMINCNVVSLTKMSAIVLPGLLKRKRGGIIINNSSAAGRVPTPLFAVYSATKAYVDFFSRCLNLEYKEQGIVVQSLCPYYVSTKLSAVRSSWIAPKPFDYVASALKTILTQPITNGCIVHNIQGWLFENVIPTRILNGLMFNILKSTRQRALNKKKRQTEQKKD